MGRLPEDEILTRLVQVPLWRRSGNVITRTVEAPSFLAGIAIVDGAAQAAEDANHHPDIDIRWRNVTFTLTTHDEGATLTDKDFDLAEKIDRVARENGA
ncbi:4a-hydroxytetrahydrobiopterin dehydratase [Actinocorallia sp. A-T 12471]|uniref:4a-hydroxytetrahydrobiopterin dehydratase n=1 Tax=Actinocorallia sp. A-T 12471 TaxID=3089813 RepID=UPI0029CD8B1F|nr:4a-hydroxytetrahydrobiopterin dehydratase [Actinocorallia sp. A-T 12471]MDX6738951.1 4a-hydroxytetrahydrobiopterin dehydratase [Actinocorallia sp. A-T 12471]